MADLKLEKLPDRNTVKITFTASAQLNGLLVNYAGLYEQTYGKQETIAGLLPYILEAFIASDAGFRKANKEKPHRKSLSQETV